MNNEIPHPSERWPDIFDGKHPKYITKRDMVRMIEVLEGKVREQHIDLEDTRRCRDDAVARADKLAAKDLRRDLIAHGTIETIDAFRENVMRRLRPSPQVMVLCNFIETLAALVEFSKQNQHEVEQAQATHTDVLQQIREMNPHADVKPM